MPEATTGRGVGERIREVRGGQSREDFAREMDSSVSSVRRYEEGERLPDAEFMLALLERRGVDPTWLLTGERSAATDRLSEPRAPYGMRYDADLLDQVVQQIYQAVARANPAPSAAAFAKLCVALYELQLSSGKGLANEVLQAVVPSAAGAATATTKSEAREPAQLDAQLREEIDAVVLEALDRAGRRVTRAQFDALCRRAYALATETGEPPATEVVTQIVQQFAEP